MTTLDTEIRKLQPVELCTLAQILNQSDSWKKLMAIVPKDTNENHYMFNNEHFATWLHITLAIYCNERMIEQAIRQQQRSGADIFLSEWSTLNKKRPTCRSMLDLLIKAELFRAADYLAVDILKSDPPKRPKNGPAAAVDVSEKALEELLKQQVDNLKFDFDYPEDTKTSWSLHFAEKSVNVIGNHVDRTENHVNQSDLMKFSSDEPNLIKFSVEEIDLPQQMSDLMKFSNVKAPDESELENYVLQEARSEDIPLCVRENAFQSNKIFSSVTEYLEPSILIDSSDVMHLTMKSKQINLPNISENVIPIVVLEYNENDKNKNNT